MAQTKAQTPNWICTFSFFATPASQFPNKFVTLVGGIILNAIRTIRHTIFARGAWDITLATETCFLCTMLNKDGYCWEKGMSPSHVSSQKRVSSSLPTVKDPRSKNSSFIFIRPFQERELEDFNFTWDRDFEWWYFVRLRVLKAICSINTYFFLSLKLPLQVHHDLWVYKWCSIELVYTFSYGHYFPRKTSI